MHSPSREREVFKFLIGLSVFTVVGFFNNCSGTDKLQARSEATKVEMSSTAPETQAPKWGPREEK